MRSWLQSSLPESLTEDVYVELFFHYTQGNPLFLNTALAYLHQDEVLSDKASSTAKPENILKLIEQGISGGLKQLLALKVEHMSAESLSLLEAASISANTFVTEDLAAMLKQDVIELEEACTQIAIQEHWLTPLGARSWPDGSISECYQFRHQLYRQFFYDGITAARCRHYHLLLAQRLQEGHQGQLEEVSAKLAWHFESGGDIVHAIKYWNQASLVASQRFAYTEAIEHVSRVIELCEKTVFVDSQVMLNAQEKRCSFLLASGKLKEVIAEYQDLIQACQLANEKTHEIRAMLGFADALFWVDRQKCLQVGQSAVKLSQQIGDGRMQVHAQGKYAHMQNIIQGYRPEHERAYEATLAMIEAEDSLEDSLDDSVKDGVKDSVEVSIDNSLKMKCIHYPRYVYYLITRSEYAKAIETAQIALVFTKQAGDANSYLGCEFFHAWALFFQGKWGNMLEVINSSKLLAGRNEHHPWLMHFQLQQAWLLIHLADYEGARKLCQPVYEHARLVPSGSLYFFSLISLIQVTLREQKYKECEQYVDEINAQLEQNPDAIDWVLRLSLLQSLAEYWIQVDELKKAWNSAQELDALATTSGEQTYCALANLYQIQIAQIQQQPKIAQKLLKKALSILSQRDLPVVAWRIYAVAGDFRHSATILNSLLKGLSNDSTKRNLLAASPEVKEILDQVEVLQL